MNRQTIKGLLGILGIWLTAGLGLPLVNVLRDFTPDQLMTVRGGLTALLVIILIKGKIFHRLDKMAIWLAICFSLVTFGLFRGIRAGGNNPTMVIMAATPLVNILLAWWRSKRLPVVTVLSFAVALAGVIITLQPWKVGFNVAGLGWAIFAMIMNGIFLETAAASRAPSLQRCFWQGLAMAAQGMIFSANSSWTVATASGTTLLLLLAFALVIGLLNFLANFLALDNLPTDTCSVLIQGVTPATMLAAYFLLGERLQSSQCLGVGLTLLSVGYLSYWLTKLGLVPATPSRR